MRKRKARKLSQGNERKPPQKGKQPLTANRGGISGHFSPRNNKKNAAIHNKKKRALEMVLSYVTDTAKKEMGGLHAYGHNPFVMGSASGGLLALALALREGNDKNVSEIMTDAAHLERERKTEGDAKKRELLLRREIEFYEEQNRRIEKGEGGGKKVYMLQKDKTEEEKEATVKAGGETEARREADAGETKEEAVTTTTTNENETETKNMDDDNDDMQTD